MRASLFDGLLKIEGYHGKFSGEVTQVEIQVETQRSIAAKSVPLSGQIRPNASFKIKDSLRQLSRNQDTVQAGAMIEKQLQLAERNVITAEKVMAALEKYIREYQPEPTVTIALKAHRLEIVNEQITVAVDNQLQLDKMEALKLHLQNILMKTLRNGYLTLSFELFDDALHQEEKKLFTASEKFRHFIQINPVIANLKSIFGLELE